MNQKLALKVLPAALLAAFSTGSMASAFQLLEQNASGIGNSYAGSAAVAENASTIFFNPAGMTKLKGNNVSAGVAVIKTQFEFENKGSSTGALSGNGGDAGVVAGVPNAYLSFQDGGLSLGLGVSAPFGLKTKYEDPWLGGAQAQEFDVKTVNLNPSVAFKVNDTVALGFGANYQSLDVKYIRIASVAPVIPIGGGLTVNGTQHRVLLEGDDVALGWNAGALFNLSPATQLGVSYRSKMDYKVNGAITVTGGSGMAATLFNAAQSSSMTADIELPDTAIVSLAQQLGDRLQLLADVSWTGWSSIKKVDIVRTSGSASGTTAQTLDTNFRDTWRAALGANFKLSEATKLKFGVAYDQTPVQNAETRLVSLPDNDRIWLSLGAQYSWSKGSAVDVGFAYLKVKETEINNNQAAQGRGTVTGTYDANVMIAGVQYSQSF